MAERRAYKDPRTHANYNLKGYYRFRHQQDAGLVLNYKNAGPKFTSDYIKTGHTQQHLINPTISPRI
jgi:hypothetical protein